MRKYEVNINNKLYSVLVKKYERTEAEFEINGKPYLITLDSPVKSISNTAPSFQATPSIPGVTPTQSAPSLTPTPPPSASAASEGSEIVTAPIPGSILEILVKEGDTVEAGQTVIKMEAMKMENDINVISSGTVQSIKVSVSDAVNQGQELIIIG